MSCFNHSVLSALYDGLSSSTTTTTTISFLDVPRINLYSLADIFSAYSKWQETELQTWLSDHSIPYRKNADKKELENLVKDSWQAKVVTPYNSWDVNQLQSYLKSKGHQVQKGTEKNKESLVAQVKTYWTETEDQASDSYNSVKDWIFDS
jgi:hypothetical protein